ncbi:MAG: hypothetical protein KGQ57_21890, partial [Burkholderiales bacterium]|nr:hypothetical protein [Burkholderiales bacterium]
RVAQLTSTERNLSSTACLALLRQQQRNEIMQSLSHHVNCFLALRLKLVAAGARFIAAPQRRRRILGQTRPHDKGMTHLF